MSNGRYPTGIQDISYPQTDRLLGLQAAGISKTFTQLSPVLAGRLINIIQRLGTKEGCERWYDRLAARCQILALKKVIE